MLSPEEQQALDLLLKKKDASSQPVVRSVKFTNWTDEDFTHTWAKVPYTVKAHETLVLEEWLARHLAKHLAERELNKENNVLVATQKAKGMKGQDIQEINIVFSPLREQYIKMCLGETMAEGSTSTELAMKSMNIKDEVKEEVVETKKPSKKKEVFEGLEAVNEATAKKE